MDARSVPSWFDVQLPWPLNYLPSIFRFASWVYIAPVILLSVIDVGGYLLFKLFYKPFGYYPMYSYFKQAPPREDAESEPNSRGSMKKGINSTSPSSLSSSEASYSSTSPVIKPSILIDSSEIHENDRHQASNIRKRTQKKTKQRHRSTDRLDTVGFEGPMLDFKSPTASDYEE